MTELIRCPALRVNFNGYPPRVCADTGKSLREENGAAIRCPECRFENLPTKSCELPADRLTTEDSSFYFDGQPIVGVDLHTAQKNVNRPRPELPP